MKDKYKKILETFTGCDPIRPQFHEPFIIDELAISTDCIQMCFIDKTKVSDVFTSYTGVRNSDVTKIIETTLEENIIVNIKLDVLNEIFKTIPTEPKMIKNGEYADCSQCGGDGVVEWEYEGYTSDFNCPVCDGFGGSSKPKMVASSGVQFESLSYVKIGLSLFDCNLIQKMIDIANDLGEPYITMAHQSNNNQGSLFKIGELKIITMPAYLRSNDGKVYGEIIN